jgi:ElaB/YqjD/DUF883 family membrane-anchored ribosome-binding protein
VAGPPEEPPTRRIDPLPPTTGVAQEREVVTEEPAVSRAEVLDEVRSLKTATAIIGVVAILALGAALWALLDNGDGDSGGDARGASNERVSDLEQRVDRLENDVEDTASDKAVSELRQDVEQLDQRVGKVSQSAGDNSGDEETQQAIEQLGQNVEQLDQRVDDVEQAQQQADQQSQSGDGGQSPP